MPDLKRLQRRLGRLKDRCDDTMKPTINLSTRSYINRHALRSALLAAITALAVWLFVGIYLAIHDVAYLRGLNEKISALEAQNGGASGGTRVQASNADLGRRWQEVSFINRLLERDTYRWTALLDQLEEQAFGGIVVRSIQPDFKNRTLSIRGYARELSHLRRFLDNLIASGEYRDVFLLDQNTKKVKDLTGQEREAIAFELSLVQEDGHAR